MRPTSPPNKCAYGGQRSCSAGHHTCGGRGSQARIIRPAALPGLEMQRLDCHGQGLHALAQRLLRRRQRLRRRPPSPAWPWLLDMLLVFYMTVLQRPVPYAGQ